MRLAVVHEQVHQRAGQYEKIGQRAQDLGLAPGNQEEGGDASQSQQGNARAGAAERSRPGEAGS
jgi:hypothetical protein